jgi:hypothetical protein
MLGSLILMFALPSIPGSALATQDSTRWSQPLALSGNDPRAAGWFPSIAVDPFGQVNVAWQGRPQGRPAAKAADKPDRMSDGAGWLMYARQSGGMWSTARDIGAIGDETDALRTALAADQNGRLHLLYRGLDLANPEVGGAENEPIRYTSVDSAIALRPDAWSPGATFSRRKPAYFADIAVDSRGVLHTLTTESDGKKSYGVVYRRSTDGGVTWSLSTALEGTLAASRWRLQLKIGPRDDLHAVWEVVDEDEPSSRNPVGFIYAQSVDGGETWTTTTFAPPKTGSVYPKQFDGMGWRVQPAVGIDGRGQTVLVWREQPTDLIYFQRSTDGREWTPPTRVGGVTRGVARPFDRFDMATDNAGRLHLVMVAYANSLPYMALLHSEWFGYTWDAPEVIATGATAPYPEWPRIAIGEGNRLHVVWFGGNSASVDRTPIGIWYSTKTTDAPPITARARPTIADPGRAPATQEATTVRHVVPTSTAVVSTGQVGTSGQGSLPANDDGNLQPALWPIASGLIAAFSLICVYLLQRWLSRPR